MTSTAARTRTAPKSAVLLGIYKGEGHACDDCNRELAARRFEVRVKDSGEVRILGRKCAARATGYPTTRVEWEAKRAEERRAFELEAVTWTVERMADHFREVVTVYRDDTMEIWAPEGGYRVVSVTEAAEIALADLRARRDRGEI